MHGQALIPSQWGARSVGSHRECGAVARPLSYAEAVVADHCSFAGLISRMEWPDRDGGPGGREETWKVVDSVCVLCE